LLTLENISGDLTPKRFPTERRAGLDGGKFFLMSDTSIMLKHARTARFAAHNSGRSREIFAHARESASSRLAFQTSDIADVTDVF
jgi:hypothetical protein